MSLPQRAPAGATIQGYLSALVKDKTVLDVGCVDHSAEKEEEDFWLHKHLVRSAQFVLGLDILESGVEELRRRGYNVLCGDGTTVSVGRTFDYVIAGEIIEHIDNASAFVANMTRHLGDSGRLVITTPYAFYSMHFLESIFASPEKRWNEQHVSWYCPFTLRNLLRRNNLEIESCYYFTRSRKLRQLMRLLHAPCFAFLASTIVVIARKR